MPLQITTVGKKRSVRALAKSLFEVKDDDQLKRAEAAIVRANPELATGKPAIGAVVLVPDAPGIPVTDAARRTSFVGGRLPELSSDRVAVLLKATTEIAPAAAALAKAAQAQLVAGDFTKAFADAHPALAKTLPDVARAIDADTQKLTRRAAQLADALKLIEADQTRAAARGLPVDQGAGG